jgi:hypothetical protein
VQAADIQRDENLWDDGQKSRLMESLMLKIPLPLFYAALDFDDVLKIVDGLQRISAIRQFVLENRFALKELEYLELEGLDYASLPDEMKIRIEETELDFVIINPDSPPEIQRNIFKRLNTGGLPLTEQEIRHALCHGPSTYLLKELVSTQEFMDATDSKVKDSRMAAQELVLRYWAFSMLGPQEYRKNEDMDSFLSDTMQAINLLAKDAGRDVAGVVKDRAISNGNIAELKKNFLLAMKRARLLFEDCAFRITTPKKQKAGASRTPINKSLFEAWSVFLGKMPEYQFAVLLKKREALFRRLDSEFQYSESILRRAIGPDSTKVSGVRLRYELIGKIINETIEETSSRLQ